MLSGRRKYISKNRIDEIATRKYRTCGRGITLVDLMGELSVNKPDAQRRLKHFHGRGVLFTARDLISEGIRILQNKNPQEYFPTIIKADIIKDLAKRKSVLVNPTGVTYSSGSISDTSEQTVIETLEGYVLPLLPKSPLFIHNIHLKLKISPEHYPELSLPDIPGNRGKRYSEIIGTSCIYYTFYPIGTVNVEVKSSNHPFKIQSEEDRSRLLIFLGQVRQVLISFLHDPHERIVPHIFGWELTECDINKDIKISGWFHLTGPKILVKYFDHLFCLYIKSMGKDTVSRIEERKYPNKKSPLEFINETMNPVERLENQMAEMNIKLSGIYDFMRNLQQKD